LHISTQVQQTDKKLILISFIGKNNHGILPALVINEGTKAVVTKCEIKGNKSHLTIGNYLINNIQNKGILCNLGSLALKETKIHNHRAGGVLVHCKEPKEKDSKEGPDVIIANCKIVFNDIVGVHFVGEESSPILEA
jgi:hypothetical protein